jgi:transcriptional regulator with XRE-family HTH domain
MGYTRPKPGRLAEKLLRVRTALGLSQTDLWRRLGLEDSVTYDRISKYETGRNEPPLGTLLQYARLAGVPTEVLIDDELDLPDRLPGPTDHTEIRRKFAGRARRRTRGLKQDGK